MEKSNDAMEAKKQAITDRKLLCVPLEKKLSWSGGALLESLPAGSWASSTGRLRRFYGVIRRVYAPSLSLRISATTRITEPT